MRHRESSSSSSSGTGVLGLLFVAFVVLKLIGKIDWSWWWVLSPAWITACIAFIVFVVVLIVKMSDKEMPNKENKKPTYRSKWEERIEEIRNSKKNNN